MLFHCDLVYAGESTRFQMPFTSLAVVPEFGSTWFAPITFGPARAAELILLGRPFDARRAAELGLVTQVVPDQEFLRAATEAARALAAKPAGALQASKRLLRRSLRDQVRAAMAAENEAFSVQVRSEEAKAALTAFLERHPPHVTEAGKTAPAN
jgi:enoyl-CoA hydratase/carnithine racemase